MKRFSIISFVIFPILVMAQGPEVIQESTYSDHYIRGYEDAKSVYDKECDQCNCAIDYGTSENPSEDCVKVATAALWQRIFEERQYIDPINQYCSFYPDFCDSLINFLDAGIELGKYKEAPKYYDKGFKEAITRFFHKKYTAALTKGQEISFPENFEGIWKMDYVKIVNQLEKLNKVRKKDFIHSEAIFNEILYDINQLVLMNLVVAFQDSLSKNEVQHLYSIYSSIHPDLSKFMHKHFIFMLQDNQKYTQHSYYEYDYISTVQAFFDIYIMLLNPLIDTIISLTKKSPFYSGTHGFEVMGSMAEFVVQEFIKNNIQRKLFTLALRKDLDLNKHQLRLRLNQVLASQYIGSDEYTTVQELTHNNIKSKIKTTTYFDGEIDTSRVRLNIDHDTETIIIEIPQKPIPANIKPLFIEYLHLEIKNSGEKSKGFSLSKDVLKALESRIDKPNETDISKNLRFTMKNTKHIFPSIKQVFEVVIAKPYSTYEICVQIGSRRKNLNAI